MRRPDRLGTTALILAGLAPVPALAAEVLPGGALDVTLSGFARFRVHGGDLDRARLDDAVSTGLDLSNDTEVHVLLRGTHDATGITYGGRVEFEADTNRSDNTDETWLFLRGGFGELRLGDEDGVSDYDYYAVSAATLAAGTGGLDGSIVDVFGGVPTFEPLGTSDATKIVYSTPRFGGALLAVSYTPNLNSPGSGSGNGDALATKDVAAGDVLEGAIHLEHELGAVGIEASLAGLVGDIKDEDALGGDDYWAIHAGAVVTVAGVKVGGSYTTHEVGALEADTMSFGAAVELGEAEISLNYGRVLSSENVTRNGIELDDSYALILSGTLGLLPGLTLASDIAYFDNDAQESTPTGDDGWQGVARLALAF